MVKEIRTKLSPPWCSYVSELEAMFGEDPDIIIKYDGKYTVKLYVNDADKATALFYILKEEADFGSVKLEVIVVPQNEDSPKLNLNDNKAVYEAAFKNNPVFSFAHKVEGTYSFSAVYIVFKNKVVQYFNDNLSDIYGNTSTLYEDIARDIFEPETSINRGIYYCTDVANNSKLKKPLGEWP